MEVWSLSYNKSNKKFRGHLEESLRAGLYIDWLKVAVFSILMQIWPPSVTTPVSEIASPWWGPLYSMVSFVMFLGTLSIISFPRVVLSWPLTYKRLLHNLPSQVTNLQ